MAGLARPVVFGEALVDAFPEALIAGGAPFNVACHLAALGLAPLLLSRIGADAGGEQLRAAATRCGLQLDGVQREPLLGTARVLVHEHADGHVFEIPADLAFDHVEADAALAALAADSPAPDAGWLYHGTWRLRSENLRLGGAIGFVLEVTFCPFGAKGDRIRQPPAIRPCNGSVSICVARLLLWLPPLHLWRLPPPPAKKCLEDCNESSSTERFLGRSVQ